MDHLSSSQINLYLLCGLKYRYQYIDNIPKSFKSSALAFGSVFHSTLSWIHNRRINGEVVDLGALYRIFDSDWYCQKLDTEIKFKDNEQELNLQLMGKEMLQLYLKEPPKKLKGSEIHFSIPIVNPVSKEKLDINLEGYIDLIEDDDTITEFKTTAQTMTQGEVDSHLQLTIYSYAFHILFQKPANDLQIVNFVKKKKPKIEKFKTSRNKKHYQGFFYLVQEVLSAIRKGVFIPHTGYWCKECEYAYLCPLMEHKTNQLQHQ